MTLIKQKYRYIGIYLTTDFILSNSSLFEKFSYRHIGLFGVLDFNNSNIRFIHIKDFEKNSVVLKCRLESVPNIILSLNLLDPEVIVHSSSGSIKKLKKKINEYLTYISNNNLIDR